MGDVEVGTKLELGGGVNLGYTNPLLSYSKHFYSLLESIEAMGWAYMCKAKGCQRRKSRRHFF